MELNGNEYNSTLPVDTLCSAGISGDDKQDGRHYNYTVYSDLGSSENQTETGTR